MIHQIVSDVAPVVALALLCFVCARLLRFVGGRRMKVTADLLEISATVISIPLLLIFFFALVGIHR